MHNTIHRKPATTPTCRDAAIQILGTSSTARASINRSAQTWPAMPQGQNVNSSERGKKMRIVATEELSGDALNWAVAKCLGVENRAGILSYSENWASAGPIIESAKIELYPNDAVMPKAVINPDRRTHFYYRQYGSTILIAAMRCFVDCELGSHVDVPDEFVQDGE